MNLYSTCRRITVDFALFYRVSMSREILKRVASGGKSIITRDDVNRLHFS